MANDIVNYNLPPWLVTKRYFTILALINPNKKSITFGNLDVYLQSLIKKLQVLWEGVQAFDVTIGEKLNLQSMCIWSVHDFPTYGLFVGCVTKGHIGCPPCGLAIESHFSRKKMVYCGSCRYLPQNHPYRCNQIAFNGETENKVPPLHVSTL